MLENFCRHIQDFFSNVWIQFVVALVLLVVGWKMNARSANLVLFFAWVILCACVFRFPGLSALPGIPRILSMMVVGGAVGLVIYYTLWTIPQTGTGEIQQPFVITYDSDNSGFFTLSSDEAHLNGRKGIFIYDFAVVNNTQGSTTLKDVLLGYEYDNQRKQVLGTILPVGKLYNGTPAIILQSSGNNIVLMNWNDIRHVIAENKERVPGAIWRGSATFVLDRNVGSIEKISNLHLVVRDYLKRESELPITPLKRPDLVLRDQSFVQEKENGELSWSKRP